MYLVIKSHFTDYGDFEIRHENLTLVRVRFTKQNFRQASDLADLVLKVIEHDKTNIQTLINSVKNGYQFSAYSVDSNKTFFLCMDLYTVANITHGNNI